MAAWSLRQKGGTAVSEELRERTDGTGSGRLGPRLVPILGWLRSYDRRWLRGDLIAGMTVAALIVPKNLGYAEIAGIPVQNGLYAAAAGAILYAIFGTCRQISMGPSSGLAAVAASAVFAAGITDQQEVASFVAGITLASGVAIPGPRRVQVGVDRSVPVACGRDRVPVRRGPGRCDRRAPQDHRHQGHRLELPTGAVLMGRRRSAIHTRLTLLVGSSRSAVVFGLRCSPHVFLGHLCWSSGGCWQVGFLI